LSTSGITSSLLSQIAGTPSTANRFVTDLNQVAQDLQSGNVSGAEDDYVTLSEDALNGASSSTATTSASGITTSLLSDIASSSSSSSSFAGELNQLGTDLGNGDLVSAQQDMLNLDSAALNAASSAGAGSGSSAAASAAKTDAVDSAELIQTIEQGMEVGDGSVVGSALSQLASISPSSQGAGVLKQDSEGYGSTSGSTSSSSSISQMLDSMDASSSGNSSSGLSLLA
jgi:hypothetical protein